MFNIFIISGSIVRLTVRNMASKYDFLYQNGIVNSNTYNKGRMSHYGRYNIPKRARGAHPERRSQIIKSKIQMLSGKFNF